MNEEWKTRTEKTDEKMEKESQEWTNKRGQTMKKEKKHQNGERRENEPRFAVRWRGSIARESGRG